MARQGGGPLPYDGIRRRTTSESSSPSLSSGKSQKTAFNDRYVLGEELGRGAFGQVSSLIFAMPCSLHGACPNGLPS